MNPQWQPSSPAAHRRASKRAGSTLIEVLAGLVVLGTLLVSVCMARGRFLHQWADADKRLTAVHSADTLLSGWLATPNAKIPIPAQQPLDGAPGYFWRTSEGRDSSAANLGAVIVRLEVFETARPAAPPVFAIDFLRHVYPIIKPPVAVPAASNGGFR